MELEILLLLFAPLILGRRGRSGSSEFKEEVYTPGSRGQVDLFERAARHVGVPEAWASSPAFIELLRRESGGVVGVPNYEFRDGDGRRIKDHPEMWPGLWAHLKSLPEGARGPVYGSGRMATGLGQLILANTWRFYPDGPQGIGDAWNEAVGMLTYLNQRWKSPERAIECYKANSCSSGIGIDGYGPKNWGGY